MRCYTWTQSVHAATSTRAEKIPVSMKPKITAIPLTNSAAALIRDTVAHHGITQAEAAEAMKVSKAQLSDVIRQKKAVSANLALRAQFCFGLPGD